MHKHLFLLQMSSQGASVKRLIKASARPIIALRLGVTAICVVPCVVVSGAATPRVARAQGEVKAVTSPIFEAISKGDLQGVKDIVKKDAAAIKAKAGYGYSPLFAAIEQRQKDIVAYLLEKGADPNEQTYSTSALDRALDNSNKDIALLLIEKGADVEKRDSEGRTPLMRHAGNANRDAVELLLSKGAKVDARDDRGRSALDLAVQNGAAETLQLLLDKGADPNARNANGNVPLHLAITRGDAALIKILLAKGADINATARSGDTPLHLAVAVPGPALTALLEAGANANARNARGDLPLHVLLRPQGGDPFAYLPRDLPNQYDYSPPAPRMPRGEDLINALVDKTDIDLKDGLGMSPLLLAIAARDVEARDLISQRKPRTDSTTQLFDATSQGDLPALQSLLKAKPFLVYFRLPNGQTPLHIAALWSTRGAAELLLEKGADINARDAQGVSPLMMASNRATGVFIKRARAMTEFLLGKGAEINARDRGNATALHRALLGGDVELITLLLNKNADVNASDKSGNTPLHLLVSALPAGSEADDSTNQMQLIKLLLEHKANPNIAADTGRAPLFIAVTGHRRDAVQLLLDKGANPNARDVNGSTALLSMIESSPIYQHDSKSVVAEIATMLLDKGADPNIRTRYNGESILMRALESSNKEMVASLLSRKADVNQPSPYSGNTPLMQAIESNSNAKEIVPLLLAAGADVKAKSNNGQSALKLATMRNEATLVELLKAKGATE